MFWRPTILALLVAGASTPGAVQHDRSFWAGIAKNRYEVPPGESADALVRELSDFLGSPDPELRDDFAYSIAAAWIYRDRRVSEKTLHELLKTWSAHLWDQGPLVDPVRFAAAQNAKDLLRSLYVGLVLDKAAPEPPRAEILKTLAKLGG